MYFVIVFFNAYHLIAVKYLLRFESVNNKTISLSYFDFYRNTKTFYVNLESCFSFVYICMACMKSCFSHVQLFETQWTVASQAPLSIGFSRQEYWSGLPCPSPGDLPHPQIKSEVAGRFFNTSVTWEAIEWHIFASFCIFNPTFITAPGMW